MGLPKVLVNIRLASEAGRINYRGKSQQQYAMPHSQISQSTCFLPLCRPEEGHTFRIYILLKKRNLKLPFVHQPSVTQPPSDRQ